MIRSWMRSMFILDLTLRKCQAIRRTQKGSIDDEIEARLEKCKIYGLVQGKPVRILRDSACTQSAIRADLVP
jgi:hypothetical protein